MLLTDERGDMPYRLASLICQQRLYYCVGRPFLAMKDGIMPCNRCLHVITQRFGLSYMVLKRTCSNRKLHFSKWQLALFINHIVNSAFWMNVLSVLSLHLDNQKYLYPYVLLIIFCILSIISSSELLIHFYRFFLCVWFYIFFGDKTCLTVVRLTFKQLTVFSIICHTV